MIVIIVMIMGPPKDLIELFLKPFLCFWRFFSWRILVQ